MATAAAEAPSPPPAADLSAQPAEGQAILHDGKQLTTIREGLAYILVPQPTTGGAGKKDPSRVVTDGAPQSVFYNPIQQFNRDLSVLAIKAYGKGVMEKRMRAAERHSKLAADKKRKRKERRGQREDAEPPVKKGKVSEEGQVSVVAEEAVQEPAEEMEAEKTVDAPVEESENKESTPAAELEEAAETKINDKTPRLKILDALSATGLRALRYAQELPFPTMVTANDLLEAAVESIKTNVKHNRLEDSIVVNHGNAIAHMYTVLCEDLSKGLTTPANKLRRQKEPVAASSTGGKYDVIDLDPYGTAATFFDAAVQSVRDDGGLLCITCTDPGVFASGGYPEKAYALYGGIPAKGFHCHEAGLRLILHGVATSAARYGMFIEPLLSLSIDYYARVFVRVTRSPAAVKFQAGRTMVVYNCDVGCGAWETQLLLKNKATPNKKGDGFFHKHTMAQAPTEDRHCSHCKTRMHMAGPMYAGNIHCAEFVRAILDDLPSVSTDVYGTTERIKGMLTTALEELIDEDKEDDVAKNENGVENGNGDAKKPKIKTAQALQQAKEEKWAEVDKHPFFINSSMLSRVLHCEAPADDMIRGALRHLGHRATRSHCKPGSIKTSAPWAVVWEVMREWVRQKAPVKEGSLREGSAGWEILYGKREGVVGEGEEEGKKKRKQEVVFDAKMGRDQNKEKIRRYQLNPRENWGPQARAVG